MGRNRPGPAGVVAGRKVDHDLFRSQSPQLVSAQPAVIEVHRAPAIHGQTDLGCGRDEGPQHRREAGVPFANVMEQCGSDQVRPIADPAGGLKTVPLISLALGKEGLLLAADMTGCPGPFRIRESNGEDDPEKPADEMEPGADSEPPRRLWLGSELRLAVDAQRGFWSRLEPGSADVAATVLTNPVLAAFDPGECSVHLIELVLESFHQAQHFGPLCGGGGSIGKALTEDNIAPELARFLGAELGQLVDKALFCLSEVGADRFELSCRHVFHRLRGWERMKTSTRCCGETLV